MDICDVVITDMLRALYLLTSSARYTRVKGEWSGDEWKDPEMFDTLLKENDYRQVRALFHTHAAPGVTWLCLVSQHVGLLVMHQTGYWEKDLLWGTSEDPVDSTVLPLSALCEPCANVGARW